MIPAEYPLKWIIGRPRTPAQSRARAGFGSSIETKNTAGEPIKVLRAVTVAGALERLAHEMRALGADQLLVSTNIPSRRDGLPFARAAEPDDPGAVLYFRLDGKPHALGVDKWDRVADNIAAIAKHVQALRGQDRWGAGTIVQAFSGHKMLTAFEAHLTWWAILGFKEPPLTYATVDDAYHRLIERAHPDRGGNPNDAAEINAARTEAVAYYDRLAL